MMPLEPSKRSRGYVKLYRSLLDSPIFKNPALAHFWQYCLLKASYKDHVALVGYQRIDLEPGQFVFGRKVAAAKTGLTEKVVRRCVRALASLSCIEVGRKRAADGARLHTVITICNWERYQGRDKDEGQTSGQKRAEEGPDLGHIQEGEEGVEKGEEVTPSLSLTSGDLPKDDDSDFDTFWAAYPRKVGKKKARQAWDRAKDRPALGDILASLTAQDKAKRWSNGNQQFCPHPTTWLNGARWEDEIDPPDADAGIRGEMTDADHTTF